MKHAKRAHVFSEEGVPSSKERPGIHKLILQSNNKLKYGLAHNENSIGC
jgi:hypothetical protein